MQTRLLAIARMDDAQIASVAISEHKARVAATFRWSRAAS
jgi:uncharacterized protein GlcG (DUF336 family)